MTTFHFLTIIILQFKMKIKLDVMFYIYNTTSTVIKQQVMNNLTTITNSISSEDEDAREIPRRLAEIITQTEAVLEVISHQNTLLVQ